MSRKPSDEGTWWPNWWAYTLEVSGVGRGVCGDSKVYPPTPLSIVCSKGGEGKVGGNRCGEGGKGMRGRGNEENDDDVEERGVQMVGMC